MSLVTSSMGTPVETVPTDLEPARGRIGLEPDRPEDTDLATETRQFVSFEIGSEVYGVDIMAVQEIKAWIGATRLPNAPPHMRGVINLRGVVVPIFDLRARFGLGATEATPKHVVILVSVGARIVGMLVDAVSDIVSVTDAEIQAIPKMDRTIDSAFLDGLVSTSEQMVALLSVDRLFDFDNLPALSDPSVLEAGHG